MKAKTKKKAMKIAKIVGGISGAGIIGGILYSAIQNRNKYGPIKPKNMVMY